MVMVDTCERVARLMVDNNESGTVTADLTINLSSRSAVALDRPIPQWSRNLPLFTQSCQHLLMAASLRPTRRAIL
ncbi:hypothetical protein TNCV_2220281 [Trichonephila clavipes]|nr:hypothetical protein TNCV_2220281 [Trichonephila clavipes]